MKLKKGYCAVMLVRMHDIFIRLLPWGRPGNCYGETIKANLKGEYGAGCF